MDKVIKGCSDCPFRACDPYGQMWQCFHPVRKKDRIPTKGGPFGELDPGEWCPLKKDSITISLK